MKAMCAALIGAVLFAAPLMASAQDHGGFGGGYGGGGYGHGGGGGYRGGGGGNGGPQARDGAAAPGGYRSGPGAGPQARDGRAYDRRGSYGGRGPYFGPGFGWAGLGPFWYYDDPIFYGFYSSYGPGYFYPGFLPGYVDAAHEWLYEDEPPQQKAPPGACGRWIWNDANSEYRWAQADCPVISGYR